MTIDPRLHRIVAAQPYPLLFATISGAHLYGFSSPDSDFDLRGAHVLPLEKVVGLDVRDETVEQSMIVPPHPDPHEPERRPPARREPAFADHRAVPGNRRSDRGSGVQGANRSGNEANLVALNEEFRLSYIAELIERKTKGENTALSDGDIAFHESEYQRLRAELQAAHEASQLPELPSEETRAALNDLLVRVRLGSP